MESAFPSSLKSFKSGNCKKKNNVAKRLRDTNVCYARRRISSKKIMIQVISTKTQAGIMPHLSTVRNEWAHSRYSISIEWTSTRCQRTLSQETNLIRLESNSRVNLTQTKPRQLLLSRCVKTATCLRFTVTARQSIWLIDRLWCDRIHPV